MKVPYVKAINDALKEEMRRDGKIVVYGEDVAEFGGIFGETRGLLEEFGPKRVRNTPIAETAIVASAVGAAITGLEDLTRLKLGLGAGDTVTLTCLRAGETFTVDVELVEP